MLCTCAWSTRDRGGACPCWLTVFAARVHPGESNSSWMVKGLIEYLTGEQAHRAKRQYRIGPSGAHSDALHESRRHCFAKRHSHADPGVAYSKCVGGAIKQQEQAGHSAHAQSAAMTW